MGERPVMPVKASDSGAKQRWSAQTGQGQYGPDRSILRSREVAYLSIKEAILQGAFEPHDRLIEEHLGAALELSRTPIREALAILEHEGLIESIPYKGLRVKPVTVQEFLSMYEALGAIEAAVARAAIPYLTSHDEGALLAVLDEAEARIPDDVVGHLAACREFQRHLGECSRNTLLTRMLVSIEERSDMHLIHSNQTLSRENMQAAVDDRRRLLDAVRSGNPDAASAAAEAHAHSIRDRWRSLYPDELHP
jgi:DNA-binding GntR family transcriptional regulator